MGWDLEREGTHHPPPDGREDESIEDWLRRSEIDARDPTDNPFAKLVAKLDGEAAGRAAKRQAGIDDLDAKLARAGLVEDSDTGNDLPEPDPPG